MSDKTERKGNQAANRPTRKPFAGRDRLTAPARQGYKRRFVKDEGGRVNAFKEAGYEVVTDNNIKTGDHSAGDPTKLGSAVTADGGSGVTLVLMEQREDWYDEDQKTKQDKIDEQEEAMFEEMNKRDGHYGKVSLRRGERA